MKLRTRLVVAILVVAIPQTVGLLVWDIQARQIAAQELLQHLLSRELTEETRLRCETDPQWGGRMLPPSGLPPGGPPAGDEGPPGEPPDGGPPNDRPHGEAPELWGYSIEGVATHSKAPAFPVKIPVSTLPLLEPVIIDARLSDYKLSVAARTGWAGHCGVLVLQGTTAPGWIGAILPATPIWLLPLVSCTISVLLAAGTVVTRIRWLTAAVEEAQKGEYRTEVRLSGNDEVAVLARAFGEAGKAVLRQMGETRQREQALREFVANTVHDVQVPLTVLRGHIAALREGEPENREKTLHAAMDEAHYLGALMHNLAAAATLDVGERALERYPVDLGVLVERVVGRHQPIARPRNITIHHAVPGSPVIVLGDVTLLEQALNNVTYNAVRYNREGGQVAMALEAGEDEFILRIFDDGPGVSPAVLARLSERGFRAPEARKRAPDGKGLGLAIAHRVAEAHALKLSFLPSEFGGLEVSFTGKIAKPPFGHNITLP